MKRQLIAFDLDNTLADSKSPITGQMADLLDRVIASQVIPSIVWMTRAVSCHRVTASTHLSQTCLSARDHRTCGRIRKSDVEAVTPNRLVRGHVLGCPRIT